MGNTGTSSTLTVYHDGQFWVGMAEHVDSGRLSVCRIVFGAEPSAEEVLDLVVRSWHRLRFVEGGEAEAPKLARNPKRRQRDAAREAQTRGPSTKAQQALAEDRERMRDAGRAERLQRARDLEDERFAQRTQKRRQKHRGH